MIQRSIIIGLIISGVSLAAGAKLGQMLADSHWREVRVQDAQQTANALARAEAQKAVLISEREQCRAEVSKINSATAEQAEKVTRLIAADQVQRNQAEQRAVVRQKQAEQRLAAAFSTLDELRRLIDAGAFKGCANERIGADIVGMLNAALTAGNGGDAGRDSRLSTASDTD